MRKLLNAKMIFSVVTYLVVLSVWFFPFETSAFRIFNNVSVSEARYLMNEQNYNKVDLILDVRTGEEYARSHIKDSVLIPIMILAEKMNEIERGQSILVYCNNGNRSKTACEFLTSKGHKYIFNMLGGIEAWIEKGYEVIE